MPTNLLKSLINFRSITPDDAGALDFCAKYLAGFEAVRVDRGGVKNLLLTKRLRQNGLNICFAGHLDVVPAGEGWGTDPFVATQIDGYIYGRGAQDMKGGVAAFLAAVREFVQRREAGGAGVKTADSDAAKNPAIATISVLLTSDEEGEAKDGTIAVLEWMRGCGCLPDMAIVAEPTAAHETGDTIKVGRRGSVNGVLTLRGIQGHAAYPEKCANPAHLLAAILPQMAGHHFDEGGDNFSPSQLVITDIRGGMEVSNVTPQSVKIMFNVRNSPSSNAAKIEAYIRKITQAAIDTAASDSAKIAAADAAQNSAANTASVSAAGNSDSAKIAANAASVSAAGNAASDSAKIVNDNAATDKANNNKTAPFSYDLKIAASSLPFITDPATPLIKNLIAATQKATSKSPILSTTGGTSDARFFAQFGVSVAEIGVPNDRIHAVNERVKIADLEALKEIFVAFLNEYADI